MKKELYQLLNMTKIPNQYNHNHLTYKHSQLNTYLVEFNDFVILLPNYSYLYNQPLVNNLKVFISAHGLSRSSSHEIDIYDKKIHLYGPKGKTLQSGPITDYLPDFKTQQIESKPLAYLYKGSVHPYTKIALQQLKAGRLRPDYFTGIKGSLSHMLDYVLTRFEEDVSDVYQFNEIVEATGDTAIIMIKQKTQLSKVLEKLDEFGKFNQYSLSFCRCNIYEGVMSILTEKIGLDDSPYNHNVDENDVDILDATGYNVSDVRASLMTTSVFSQIHRAGKAAQHDANIIRHQRFENKLKDEILIFCELRKNDYTNCRDYHKYNIFSIGYSANEKLQALNSLIRGLNEDYRKRRFLLSPQTKKILFNGRLGRNLKNIASTNMLKSRTDMLHILGFDVH